MKLTLFTFILSLTSISFAIPVVLDAHTSADLKAAVIPRGAISVGITGSAGATVGGGVLNGSVTAGLKGSIGIRRAVLAVDTTIGADAAAGAEHGLGVIPIHAHNPRDVQTVEAAFIPIEAQVHVLAAKLSSKTITVDEAEVLISQLVTLLTKLQAQLQVLAGVKVDAKVLSIHISALIGTIVKALKSVTVTLGSEINILKPLIASVGAALQASLNVAVGVSAGLGAQLAVALKPLVAILVKLGLHLHIGGLTI